MNIALVIWAVLHCFYGFILAQLDLCNTENGDTFRYAGWLIGWPIVLILIAIGKGDYFIEK